MKFKKLLKALSITQNMYVTTWHDGHYVETFRVDDMPKFDERCIALAKAKVKNGGVHASKRDGCLYVDLVI